LTQIYVYAAVAFAIGFAAALGIHLLVWIKSQKKLKSVQGFLDSEKLIRERFQKENAGLHQLKEISQHDMELKIRELQAVIKTMDEDILLLQKSNEETEALLNSGDPMIHTLKLKLIEANNTIARYKSQVLVK